MSESAERPNEADRQRTRALFGRRHGKALRAGRQQLVDQLLPRLRVDLQQIPKDPLSGFPNRCRQLWLEIGFGAGEHLAAQAQANADVAIIGAEPFINGVASLLSLVSAEGLDNVRIHDDDARSLMDVLPDAAIDRAFILFADPWPKTRHHCRRFICDENLDVLARRLKDEAELRIATDHADYGRWILWHVLRHPDFEWMVDGPDDWRERGADWPATRYEMKGAREGRKSVYFRFRRRPRRPRGPRGLGN